MPSEEDETPVEEKATSPGTVPRHKGQTGRPRGLSCALGAMAKAIKRMRAQQPTPILKAKEKDMMEEKEKESTGKERDLEKARGMEKARGTEKAKEKEVCMIWI